MRFDLFIKNAIVVLESELYSGGIAIKDGKIAKLIAPDETVSSAQTIDAQGCVLMPGGIDTHSHFFEPGPNYREDILHGTKAAASGGYTTVMDMPNTDPPVDSPNHFFLKAKLFAENAVVDYALWGASLPGKADRIAEIRRCGCPASKAFVSDAGPSYPSSDSFAIFEGMQAVKAAGGIYAAHAEDQSILDGLRRHYDNQQWSLTLHDATRPWYAELSAISKLLLFAKVTGCPLHICHTSIPEGVELAKAARVHGVDVTIETCPHYLLFDYESIAETGPYSLICPPIRSRERVDRMWELVRSGDVAYMGTDHAPYTDADKNPENLWDAPGGAPSIDIAIPAILEEGVKRRGLSLPQMSAFLSSNAAKRFDIYPQKGVIREGADADLIFVDMDCKWQYSRRNTFSKTCATGFPYEGKILTCRVIRTLVRGETVYLDGQIMAKGGYGQLICPLQLK